MEAREQLLIAQPQPELALPQPTELNLLQRIRSTKAIVALSGLAASAAIAVGAGEARADEALPQELASQPSSYDKQAAKCAYRALARGPKNMRGNYIWDADSRDPEGQDETRQAFQYYVSFKLPKVSKPGLNCSKYGKRIVEVRQESYRKGNIIDTSWQWWPGADKKTVKTNNSKHVSLQVRAPRMCWPSPYSRNADYDKRKGSKGRPMVEVKWAPKRDGERQTKTYRGKTKKLC
jgi:hypothetical protein